MSLRTVLVVTATLLVVASIALVGIQATRLIERLADDQARARAELAVVAAGEAFGESGAELATSTRLLAERPTLRRLATAGDSAGLRAFLARFAATGGLAGAAIRLDGAIVAGGDGHLPWTSIADDTEPGSGWTVFAGHDGAPAVLVAAEPVDGVAGAVVVGARRVDSAFEAALSARAGTQIAVWVAGSASVGDPAIDLLRRRAFDNVASVTERPPASAFYVSTRPLRAPSGATVAGVQATLDAGPTDAAARRMVGVLFVSTAGIAAVAAICALLVAAWVTRPLRSLTWAALRIGRGDLDRPVPAVAGEETRVLGEAMEEMRTRLARLTGELRRERADAEAVLRGISDGVYAVDAERRVTYLNPRALEILGVEDADEAIGTFCGDLLRPEPIDGARPCEDHCPILDARARGGARAVESVRLPHGRHGSLVIASAGPPADVQPRAGESFQFQIVRDETDSESARRLRDAVLANVSHEFRTPLSAQLASIEMLRERLDDDERLGELVRSIERGAVRLTRLIDNLLESLRIEAGRDTIRHAPVALDQVVEEAVEMTAALIAQKRQSLDLELPYPLPEILGDAPRLTQVFVNLLANANKFAPAGTPIRVAGAVDDDEVAIWVEDRGPGISDDDAERLFERFRRAPGEEPAEGGMGLGLWIVRSIAERHGGRVEARASGGGTRVTVSLPRRGEEER